MTCCSWPASFRSSSAFMRSRSASSSSRSSRSSSNDSRISSSSVSRPSMIRCASPSCLSFSEMVAWSCWIWRSWPATTSFDDWRSSSRSRWVSATCWRSRSTSRLRRARSVCNASTWAWALVVSPWLASSARAIASFSLSSLLIRRARASTSPRTLPSALSRRMRSSSVRARWSSASAMSRWRCACWVVAPRFSSPVSRATCFSSSRMRRESRVSADWVGGIGAAGMPLSSTPPGSADGTTPTRWPPSSSAMAACSFSCSFLASGKTEAIASAVLRLRPATMSVFQSGKVFETVSKSWAARRYLSSASDGLPALASLSASLLRSQAWK